MTLTQIILERQNTTAWIKLNRPDKLNALTPTMLQEWKKTLEELATDNTCNVVVVSGEGRAFSAGVDLSVFEEMSIIAGNAMHTDGMQIMHLLETMPQATIAMVNGFCFTGAMEIMMAFDLVIAAEEAKIGDTHAKWGIQPTWGMTQRLQRQVGLRKAKELSFTAQAISGEEAARIGLANKAVPLKDLKSTVEAMANRIAGNSAQTIAAVKELYQYGSLHTHQEGRDFEQQYKVEITDKAEDLKNFKKNI